jgi:tRNA threonylcarbamoyladenosine biosynthesis protein TsaE
MINSFKTKSIEDLESVVNNIIPYKSKFNIWVFYGQMGAGKTTLIRKLCKKLGVIDNPNSPTFSLVNEYHTSLGEKIYHFDFFRINSIDEAFDLGYEEYLYSGNLCLIEWPEKIESLLPEKYLKITIEVHDKERIFTLS